MKKILITIDGPSGSGKSTVGRALAQDLNIEFFSSGSLYRAIAYYLKNKVRLIDSISLVITTLAIFPFVIEPVLCDSPMA